MDLNSMRAQTTLTSSSLDSMSCSRIAPRCIQYVRTYICTYIVHTYRSDPSVVKAHYAEVGELLTMGQQRVLFHGRPVSSLVIISQMRRTLVVFLVDTKSRQ